MRKKNTIYLNALILVAVFLLTDVIQTTANTVPFASCDINTINDQYVFDVNEELIVEIPGQVENGPEPEDNSLLLFILNSILLFGIVFGGVSIVSILRRKRSAIVYKSIDDRKKYKSGRRQARKQNNITTKSEKHRDKSNKKTKKRATKLKHNPKRD